MLRGLRVETRYSPLVITSQVNNFAQLKLVNKFGNLNSIELLNISVILNQVEVCRNRLIVRSNFEKS